MRLPARLAALLLSTVLPGAALAGEATFTATLKGHAVMPANTIFAPPADAPEDLKMAGKYTSGRRVEAAGTVEGLSDGRPTGLRLPFAGQARQGHSGIKRMADGTFWVLTDNGFGAKANSPDAMLFLSRYRIDWARGTVETLETVFLHDPDKRVPFRIVHEGTAQRYLTGSDFDPESIQIAGGKLWIGEEFGPFLLRADMSGKVEAVIDTVVDGKPVRSPDHPAVTTPPTPSGSVAFNLRRSKGFEGMASSPDGSRLYPLLEGPLWDAAAKDWERTADGRAYLRILEFDVAAGAWTGRHWKYVLEADGNAIGDFNMIDGRFGLVIERDDGEGTPDRACPAGTKRPDCFGALPKTKRVFKIELGEANVNGPVRKVGSIDLLRIADPGKVARTPLDDGHLAFPFFTIENVEIVDERHIVVGNDNNLPFSSSRDPNRADDNEFVLLDVADLLAAR